MATSTDHARAATRSALACLAPALACLAVLASFGLVQDAARIPGAARTVRDPLRWISSCGQRETYLGERMSGSIAFTPCAQELEIRLRAGAGERIEREVPLAPLRPQWLATTFAPIAPHELVVAGYDFDRECGLVLRMVFEPATWELVAVHELVASPALLGIAALEPFADGKRIAVLDRETAAVHVLDLERGRLDLVHRGPTVRDMKDVSAERLDTGGVKLWLTSCDASTAYHVPPTLLGPTISLYDWDGDGTFESASPNAGRPTSPTGPVPAARRAARVRR